MNKTNRGRMVLGCLSACAAMSAAAAEPAVSDVVVRQRWPWSRLVDVEYVLACDAPQRADVALTAYDGEAVLALPEESLAGKRSGLSAGAHRIVWDPMKTAYTNSLLTRFRVQLTAARSPEYMVVDLSGGPTATAYPVAYYEGTNALPFGGLTNELYKTSYLVLRRIYAGEFKMGDSVPPTNAVTLTRDYYAGVYEVTQGQWARVKGGTPPSKFFDPASRDLRPVEQVSYDQIRGTAAQGGGGWPTNNAAYESSFVGLLRAKTGVAGFDLPTEAQWECACRAGTLTYYNDGKASPVNSVSNSQMDVLGRYKHNGGMITNSVGDYVEPPYDCSPSNGTAVAGTYVPNAWGLYDMHGNVWEWCLDWYGSTPVSGTDPKGAETGGTERVKKSGDWTGQAWISRSANRHKSVPANTHRASGFRIFNVLP